MDPCADFDTPAGIHLYHPNPQQDAKTQPHELMVAAKKNRRTHTPTVFAFFLEALRLDFYVL
jgi:hypothetical protein